MHCGALSCVCNEMWLPRQRVGGGTSLQAASGCLSEETRRRPCASAVDTELGNLAAIFNGFDFPLAAVSDWERSASPSL